MISVTERAGNRLQSLAENTNTVEFSVNGGGCSGMSYSLKFTDRKENDRDQIIMFNKGNMKMLVPFASYVYLTDTEIDFSDDLLNGGFKFNNPQAERGCGCGISFSV
jgi:iron-sulfur cluster assembly protein